MPDTLTCSTLSPPEREVVESKRVTVLTILCHPDLRRIGERAVLDELRTLRRVGLSRSSPLFGASGGDAPRPLGDPYLSRQPLEISPGGSVGTLELRPSSVASASEVDGTRLDALRLVSPEELDRGVVIELAGRVVLLLHREEPRVEGPSLPAFGLVGESQKIETVQRSIRQVATLPVAVLLRGETGSGKELVARAIAEASPYRAPFIPVNMGAIPASVAASELFGTGKGAFTGAVPSEGYFRKADGGTLFLDEIGQTPYEIQAHLLRALESGEVQPLGERAPFRVKVRVIAATDSDLEGSIARGQFMESLLQRLGTFQISIPSLRERIDDLGRLLVHFLRAEMDELGEQHRLEPVPMDEPAWLPARLVARLARYEWPGNVRELRNVARRLAISSRGQSQVNADLELRRRGEEARRPAATAPAPEVPEKPAVTSPGSEALRERRAEGASAEEIREVLRATGRNFTQAARALGISRTTLLKRTRELGLYRRPDEVTDAELLALAEKTNGDLDAMAEGLLQARRGLELRLARLQRRQKPERSG